ncbi:MAG: mechanosensitive ion channel [Proteobacteria bacterium]|nr:MAG: mechanosensitive ion channel [Pseudomonadota bacterium]
MTQTPRSWTPQCQYQRNVPDPAAIAFVLIAAPGQLGVQSASFVAIIGATGLAIALALHRSWSNLAAGARLVTFCRFSYW